MAQQKLYEAEAEVETRNLPRCDPGLPRDTQNCMGTAGNVLNDHLPKKDSPVQSPTISRIWQNPFRN